MTAKVQIIIEEQAIFYRQENAKNKKNGTENEKVMRTAKNKITNLKNEKVMRTAKNKKNGTEKKNNNY